MEAIWRFANVFVCKVWVEIYSWKSNFFHIRRWVIFASPKPSRIISYVSVFMRSLKLFCCRFKTSYSTIHTHPPGHQHSWKTPAKKNRWWSFSLRLRSLFGRMNGRMADGSFKIWITQFKVAVVFVLNNQHQHSRASFRSQGWKNVKQVEVNLKAKPLLPSRADLTSQGSATRFPTKIAKRRRNNSDWWMTSPLGFSFSLQLCWGYHFEKHYF